MTVASQLIQTIAGLKGVQASLETLAIQTQDQRAKEVFCKAVKEMSFTLESLNKRLEFVKNEEPQFK